MKNKYLTVFCLILIGKLAKSEVSLSQTAEFLCKNNPEFIKGCKDLTEKLKNTVTLLKKIKNHGYEDWKHLHSHCEKVGYKDIFGLCQNLRENEEEIDKFIIKVIKKILKISSLKTENGKGVYYHCKEKKNLRNNLCKNLVNLAQNLPKIMDKNKKKKEEDLLTGTINSVCDKRPYLKICKHMVALASIMSKVENIKEKLKNQILAQKGGNGNFENFDEKFNMFAMRVLGSGREVGNLEEFCGEEGGEVCGNLRRGLGRLDQDLEGIGKIVVL